MLISINAAGPVYVFDRPTRILVADDDPILCEFAAAQLGHPGGAVVTAADGEEAWAHLEGDEPFDLVLSDLEMPRLSGFGLVERIRRSPRHLHLPVVVVTSREDMFAIDRAYEVGATSFVTKPVNWRLLGYELRYVLRGSRMESEVRAARDEAERAVELRASLLALLQHETRTPLNSIIGYSEILRAAAGGSLSDCADQVVISARSLNETLRRIFYFVTLSGQTTVADPEIVRASHLVEELVGTWQAAARRAGVGLRLAPVGEDALIGADMRHLAAALGELISNAIAHGAGSDVEVAVERRAGGVVLAVADRGPGIDQARLQRCLEPFGQGGDPLTRASEGLGLGLPTARRIAALHGGALTVDTSPRGTTARFHLPTAQVAQAYGT
jgi:signal transduction histidine kinase